MSLSIPLQARRDISRHSSTAEHRETQKAGRLGILALLRHRPDHIREILGVMLPALSCHYGEREPLHMSASDGAFTTELYGSVR